MPNTTFYALKTRSGDAYINIYATQMQVRMCMGKVPEPMYKIELALDESGKYYGWLDYETREYSMIWPSRAQFRCCFTYGVEAEEERGRGKAVRFTIVNEEILQEKGI